MAEFMDVYDGNRLPTGKTRPRGDTQRDGEYFLVAMVLIFNTAGEMLIQQRQSHLGWYPDKWTMTAGGGVLAGETPAEAASRELYEELGITMSFEGVRPNFTMTQGTAFMDYFLVTADINLAELNVPNSEVAAVKWVGKSELVDMSASDEAIVYNLRFLDFVFDGGRILVE